MRTIDADALLQTVSIKSVFGNEINKMKCGELRTILEMIENAPTVEPQRKSGKWIKASEHECISTSSYVFRCSECGETFVGAWSFCPNCGADMREKE